MDEWGIDLSIIMDSLAYIGLDQRASNDYTRAQVAAYPDRLLGPANITALGWLLAATRWRVIMIGDSAARCIRRSIAIR